MKKHLTLLASIALILAGCGEKKPTLHVFTFDDYINPELIPEFEEKHGCRVEIDTYPSNEEMLTKIKAGSTGYDILVPSSYMVKILDKEGMLQPIDHAKAPNAKANIDPDFLRDHSFDKEMRVSVPYMFAATSFAYLADKVQNVEPTWKVFERADLKGRMTLLNDMRETLGAALKSLGYSLNTTDPAEIQKARDVVIGWKKNIAKFDSDQYRSGIASGEFLLVHGYTGDLLQSQETNDQVTILIPEEGTSIACDDLVIPKDAPNPDLAHAWINFLCHPEVAAKNVSHVFYLAPNKPSYDLLDPEIRNDPSIFLERSVLSKSEIIDELSEEVTDLYEKAWDEIKAAAGE